MSVEVERNTTYRKGAQHLRATHNELGRLQELLRSSMVRDSILREDVAEWIDGLAKLAGTEDEA